MLLDARLWLSWQRFLSVACFAVSELSARGPRERRPGSHDSAPRPGRDGRAAVHSRPAPAAMRLGLAACRGALQPLRKKAETEIRKAQAAFREARGLSWFAFLNVPLLLLSKYADYKALESRSPISSSKPETSLRRRFARAGGPKRRSYEARRG